MEETKTNVTTVIETVTDKEKEVVKTIKARSPLFLVFAEFMGYASPLLDWASIMCEGKTIESFKEKAIEIDALNIFNKMQKEFSLEDIKEMWESYYEVILQDSDEKLEKAEKEKLPF